MAKITISLDQKTLKELKALSKKVFVQSKQPFKAAIKRALREWMQREIAVQRQKEILKDPPF